MAAESCHLRLLALRVPGPPIASDYLPDPQAIVRQASQRAACCAAARDEMTLPRPGFACRERRSPGQLLLVGDGDRDHNLKPRK